MNNIVFLIPIIALTIPIVAIITRGKHKRLELELKYKSQNVVSVDGSQMHNEIRQLKERIIVLERVITDGNSASALDREIEKLR
jgi:hypothetical protein